MALLQLWAVGVDLFLGGGLVTINAFNALFLVFFVALASSKEEKFHRISLGIAWMLFISAIGLQGFEVI
jgi:hypothetical protein